MHVSAALASESMQTDRVSPQNLSDRTGEHENALRPFTLALLREELETTRQLYLERLLQMDEPGDESTPRRRRIQRELDAATDAISRMDDGTYGYCQACSVLIPDERLEASPLARYCIDCIHTDGRDHSSGPTTRPRRRGPSSQTSVGFQDELAHTGFKPDPGLRGGYRIRRHSGDPLLAVGSELNTLLGRILGPWPGRDGIGYPLFF